MQSILNFFLFAGFVFVLILFLGYLVVRSHQAVEKQKRNEEANESVITGR
ncbi:MAG: hypothetical protein JJU05_14595 [Verrucomicrobia bacterium]|nr:hypothetical protein [Verrucomicrobiota bacterium]MCH8528317.1 hypothetical protein [Kiritimatiellia bacterium]